MVKRIVIGVDGSAGSNRALHWAIGLAREQEAEIIAVYALGPVGDLARGTSNAVAAGLGLRDPEAGRWREELRRDVEREWCAPLQSAGVPYRVQLETHSAPAALMCVADAEDADLIVVGAHGHGSFEDRVLGSVSYKVSHRAHQPVVIVPPEGA